MSEAQGHLEADGAAIAWRRTAGRGPTVVWLGGFRSEMTGTKAEALAGGRPVRVGTFCASTISAMATSPADFEARHDHPLARRRPGGHRRP